VFDVGLRGYRSFDTSTGTDDSGNGNTGSVLNGVIFSGGKVGKAAQFDGVNDYIRTPTVNLSGDFSISFWIQPTWLHNYGDPLSA